MKEETSGRIRVFMTFDADPDGVTARNPNRSAPTWKGFERVPRALALLRSKKMPSTAFLRADDQIRDLFDDALGAYHAHAAVFEQVLADGGELGWHPHLYRRRGSEYVPVRASREASAQLRSIHQELGRLTVPLRSVRLGEAWHSTETMNTLDELGYRVDSTALPGRARKDAAREFDWSSTPNRPYHPSRIDYRISSAANAERLSILELPMTTAPIKTSYDPAPVRRYLSLSYQHRHFDAALSGALTELAAAPDPSLVLIFHPCDLLDLPENDLYAFGLTTFERNLEALCRALSGSRKPEFLRVSEASL